MRTLNRFIALGLATIASSFPLAAQTFTRLISVGDPLASSTVNSIGQLQVNTNGDWAAVVTIGTGFTSVLVVNGVAAFKTGDGLPSSLCIGNIGSFEMNNNGDIVVDLRMTSCPGAVANDDALFFFPTGATSAASLVQVVREGDPSPLVGTPAYASLPAFRFGDDNTVLVAGVFTGSSLISGLVEIFLNAGGTPTGDVALIESGATALGTAPPTPPLAPDYVVDSFNSAQHTLAWKWTSPSNPLFITNFANPGGPTPINGLAMYLDSGSPISAQIARMGDTIPGGGSVWRTFLGSNVNQCGEVAYLGQVGSGLSAVLHLIRWQSPSSVQELARTGSSLLFGSSMRPLGFFDSRFVLCEGPCSGSGPGEIIWSGASTTATGGVTAIFANAVPLVVENVTSDGTAVFTHVAFGNSFSMDASDDGRHVVFSGSSGGGRFAHTCSIARSPVLGSALVTGTTRRTQPRARAETTVR